MVTLNRKLNATVPNAVNVGCYMLRLLLLHLFGIRNIYS